MARKFAETPANLMTPELFAKQVGSSLQSHLGPKVSFEDYTQEWAEEQKMNAFLAVAKGSEVPPHFVVIRYNGGVQNQRPLALVGKGVTFDSGGISIKPSGHMGDMKGDMMGAAIVASTATAIIELNLPINMVCVMPLCENMPSGMCDCQAFNFDKLY